MANLIAKYEPKSREWYENPPVVYGFQIPKVRAKLEWLMGSHIVQALDRGYQTMLQEMMQEDFSMNVKKRNQDRQREEISREKQLVLEGKMALEEAPKGIAKNPVLQINAMIEKMQKEKDEQEQKFKVSPIYNYDYTLIQLLLKLRGVQTSGYGETVCDVSSCYKIQKRHYIIADVSEGILVPAEEYTHRRPEEADIMDLYQIKGVVEMYKRADRILGYEPLEEESPLTDTEGEEEEEEEEDEG